jgi:putative NIF3 family GTP cyclohydrolase 1 type 2
MALLARVLKSMERIAPQSLADHAWDNVGLLVGMTLHSPLRRSAPVDAQGCEVELFFFYLAHTVTQL